MSDAGGSATTAKSEKKTAPLTQALETVYNLSSKR